MFGVTFFQKTTRSLGNLTRRSLLKNFRINPSKHEKIKPKAKFKPNPHVYWEEIEYYDKISKEHSQRSG